MSEETARVSACEAAGWNSPTTRKVWVVSPDLTGSYDEVYFQGLDDALEYIQENLAEKIQCDMTEEELGETGFNLQLWPKLISQELWAAVFARTALRRSCERRRMADIRIELSNCTQTLLHEIETGGTRDSVALTYAMAIVSSEPTDWAAVNKAILAKWCVNALTHIKTLAWRLVEEKRREAQANG